MYHYNDQLRVIFGHIKSSIEFKSSQDRYKAIRGYENLLADYDITDYLLIDSQPEFPRDLFLESWFNLGTLYKTEAETLLDNGGHFDDHTVGLFHKAISAFKMMLRVEFEDARSHMQIVSCITKIVFHCQPNWERCIRYLQEGLVYVPQSDMLHYNLGFCYHKLLKLELALIHFKIALELVPSERTDGDKARLNCLHGISSIYKNIKQWPEALHYLTRAKDINPDDPDICNQLGIVYTEMRRTDLALDSYERALEHVKESFITSNHTALESEIYLNMGFMHSYNGDNIDSVECYNKALVINPRFPLPFQNKIMNLNYFVDLLPNVMYNTNQHKLVNRLYTKMRDYKFENRTSIRSVINIGFISGDFIEHPVSFFISTFLRNYDTTQFHVTCYSECVINTAALNDAIKFTFIKNKSAAEVADQIYNDQIDILFDLAGHTAFNRMDVFAQRPAPIQISYIGYPFTTGLHTMDYRITDHVCEGDTGVSDRYYTEKLVYLPNCFLCYDPKLVRTTQWTDPHLVSTVPFLQNGYLTIGCFNRVNKMTDRVTKLFNKILLTFPDVRFVFKTKALINLQTRKRFIVRFSESVRDRITVLDCTIQHREHLLTYNQVDIAIDTFPYSGTTTSCEALYMGVPVLSLYDTERYIHAHNVTVSILKNSGLNEYVCNSSDEFITKIKEIQQRPHDWWANLKLEVRNTFLNGKVCDGDLYMKNFQSLLKNLSKSASSHS